LLQSLRTGSDQQPVQERLGSEEPLVLEHRDSEVDLVHPVSLFGSLDLDETFGLKRSELVLHLGGLGGVGTEVRESLEAFFLSAFA